MVDFNLYRTNKMKQIMSEAVEEGAPIEEDIARARYRKSHNHYEPSEQVTRE